MLIQKSEVFCLRDTMLVLDARLLFVINHWTFRPGEHWGESRTNHPVLNAVYFHWEERVPDLQESLKSAMAHVRYQYFPSCW